MVKQFSTERSVHHLENSRAEFPSDKQCFLLVTDLHDHDKKKDNRISYSAEIQYVKDKILSLVLSYKQQGYRVNVIFLGDIFDRGFSSATTGIKGYTFFLNLLDYCEKLYSVIGNHELSFYSNNPFYACITQIDSEKIKEVKGKIHQPLGGYKLLTIPDTLKAGDVNFIFNHYSTKIGEPESGFVNIGLFHQEVVCSAIVEQMQQAFAGQYVAGKTIDYSKVGVFDGYDFAFMGHNHKIYGQWDFVDDISGARCVIQHLASLGRPNVTEVNDSFLERDIPAVLIEGDKFRGIQHNLFNLMSYDECVIASVVETKKRKAAEIKTRMAIKSYVPLTDDPIQNIIGNFMASAPGLATMLQEIEKTGSCSQELMLQQRLINEKEVIR